MKKLSLSFGALLAIVFALSSAFTTPQKSEVSTTDWVLLANINTYNYSARTTTFEGSGQPIDNVATYVLNSPGKIKQFAEAQVDFTGTVQPCNGFTTICSLDFPGAPFVSGELAQTALSTYLSSSSYAIPAGFNLYN